MDQQQQQQGDDIFSERGNRCSPLLTASLFHARNDITVDLIRTKEYSNVNKIANCNHLTDENWHEWKDRMKCVFTNCDITGYVMGAVSRLNESDDPVGACNWDKNDSWAQQVIIHNVTSSQMNHVGSRTSAEAMYSALMVTHENKAHQMVNYIQCLLYETKEKDSDDLLRHLDILKSYHDHINKFPNAEFHVSDTCFKSIISASLPSTWQTFVEPYNGNANNPNDPDPKWCMSSDALIGLLQEEYKIWVNQANNGNNNGLNGSVNLVQTRRLLEPVNPLRLDFLTANHILTRIVTIASILDIGPANAINLRGIDVATVGKLAIKLRTVGQKRRIRRMVEKEKEWRNQI